MSSPTLLLFKSAVPATHCVEERPHHSRPLWFEVRAASESKLKFTAYLSQIWSQAIRMFVLVLWGLIKSNRCTQDIKKEDLKISGYPPIPHRTFWRHATLFLSHEYTFAYSTASLLFPVSSITVTVTVAPKINVGTFYILAEKIQYIIWYSNVVGHFLDLTVVSVWYSVNALSSSRPT